MSKSLPAETSDKQTSHFDSTSDPLTDLNINTAAQFYIVEVCRQLNGDVKIVFASTLQIYGRHCYLPVDEKHPLQRVDVNGVNRLAGESYHLLFNDVYRIRASVLRLTNTDGREMRVKDARQTFLGIRIRRLLERSAIQVFGSGAQRRNFDFIGEVGDVLLAAVANPASEGEIFNLGHHEHVTLRALADMLVEMRPGGRYEVVSFPSDRQAIDVGDCYSDFSKIGNALDWKPRVCLQEGLPRTVEYYAPHHAHYWNSGA